MPDNDMYGAEKGQKPVPAHTLQGGRHCPKYIINLVRLQHEEPSSSSLSVICFRFWYVVRSWPIIFKLNGPFKFVRLVKVSAVYQRAANSKE